MDLLTLPLWSALVQRGSEELGDVLRTSQRLLLQDIWNEWWRNAPRDDDYVMNHLCLAPAWMRWYGEWEEKDPDSSAGDQPPASRFGILVQSSRLRWHLPETMRPLWHDLLHALIISERHSGSLSDQKAIAALAALAEPHATLEVVEDSLPPSVRNTLLVLSTEMEWLVHVTVFSGVHDRSVWNPWVVGHVLFCVGPTGDIVEGKGYQGIHWVIPGPRQDCWHQIPFLPGRFDQGLKLLCMAAWGVFHRTQLTLFSPHEYLAVTPSRQARRAAERDGDPPLCSFSILRVGGRAPARTRPMPVLSGRGRRARHVQRGHFKRYLGKRLFGRWSGVWYWQEGRPGGAPRVHAKDYVILPFAPRSVNFTSQ